MTFSPVLALLYSLPGLLLELPIPLTGVPTDPQRLLQQVIDQYGSALLGFAVKVLIFLLAFFVIYLLARTILVRFVKKALDACGFDRTVRGLGGSIAKAVAFFGALAVAATLIGFGAVLGAFATLLGALSLALGFAAQDMIENFVAGIFILRDKPFQIGDWIEWYGDTERTGVVKDIQLRVTKLETFDNELITVPNSELASTAVKNPVANRELRVPFTFGVGYGDDIDQAREIILEEARTVDVIETDPEPNVIVTELGDSAVGLVGRAHITDPSRGKYVNAVSDWVEAVKNRFDAEGIDMPYPYTELTGTLGVESIRSND
jgi:small-conductance mechanosensitive channel